jgi:hypothetical protein
LVAALEYRIVGYQMRSAVVAKETSALGAMISILVDFAATDGTLFGIAESS